MRKMRIVKQVGCAILAGALVIGQIFGSGASLITAKAAESWVDTQKITNGDFETGDSSEWTLESGSGAALEVKSGGSNVNSTYYLNIWASDQADVSIKQTVSSVSAELISWDLMSRVTLRIQDLQFLLRESKKV